MAREEAQVKLRFLFHKFTLSHKLSQTGWPAPLGQSLLRKKRGKCFSLGCKWHQRPTYLWHCHCSHRRSWMWHRPFVLKNFVMHLLMEDKINELPSWPQGAHSSQWTHIMRLLYITFVNNQPLPKSQPITAEKWPSVLRGMWDDTVFPLGFVFLHFQTNHDFLFNAKWHPLIFWIYLYWLKVL